MGILIDRTLYLHAVKKCKATEELRFSLVTLFKKQRNCVNFNEFLNIYTNTETPDGLIKIASKENLKNKLLSYFALNQHLIDKYQNRIFIINDNDPVDIKEEWLLFDDKIRDVQFATNYSKEYYEKFYDAPDDERDFLVKEGFTEDFQDEAIKLLEIFDEKGVIDETTWRYVNIGNTWDDFNTRENDNYLYYLTFNQEPLLRKLNHVVTLDKSDDIFQVTAPLIKNGDSYKIEKSEKICRRYRNLCGEWISHSWECEEFITMPEEYKNALNVDFDLSRFVYDTFVLPF